MAKMIKKKSKIAKKKTKTEKTEKKSKVVAEKEPKVNKAPAKKRGTVESDAITPKGLKLIAQADKLETAIEDAKDQLTAVLQEIKSEVGVSFMHPDREVPMCVMERGDTFFLRRKPDGGVEKRLATMAKNARSAKKKSKK